jgi:hypothetical protein
LYYLLQKSLNILKWFFLVLAFWSALALLFIVVKPVLPSWLFYTTLLGWLAAWLWVFKKVKQKISFFLFIIFLLGSVWFTLHLSSVQTWLVRKVTNKLSRSLHTELSIRHIDFHFFDKLDLKGLYVQDLHKDTLLYAGTATIQVTDWFFLKDKITLHYVSLEDVQVNLHRSTDTIWNHQFLIDYFSGPKKSKDTSGGGIDLALEELKLHNISFRQIDQWKGKDMIGTVKDLDLVADTFDLKRQRISIHKLDINEPGFTISDYTGERDRRGIQPPVTIRDTSKQNGGLVITVKNLHISNGTFNNNSETPDRAPYTDQFDGSHLQFAAIHADMKNVRLANDTLTTDLTLATKERSGFEVKKLQANMKFTPEIMEFNNLDLVTNKSRLGNYYSMRYDDFDEDMGHFLHQIKLQANFVNSELNTDDLSFFAPELKTWKRVFNFSGNARGTIDNLVANKMLIKSGNSSVNGDITIRGLPDIDSAFIDFTSRDLQTNYDDLTILVPSLKQVDQPKLSRLGNIVYKGNFTGTISDFVAFGTINTNLGAVTGDLNLKLPANKAAVYSGKLSTQNFKLGQFLDDNNLGTITFNGKVNGSGFSSRTLDARFDGNVSNIDYNGYNYKNIALNGSFKKKLFNGFASINDPNLKVDNLTGTIDFNGAEPQFNFDALLANADFKKLGFAKGDFSLKGHFNLNFTGDNIDNFLGTASIDSLVLESKIEDGQKHLSLRSNEADADITGNFKIQDLPESFQTFLSRYYPAYIQKPSHLVSDQDFSFEIKTKNIDEYIQLADSRLKGFDNSKISGNLKLKSNELNIRAQVPEFSYDGKIFNNVLLEGKGSFDSLATKITAEDVAISDSMHLPFANLAFTSSNNVSDISLKTSASKTLSEASINARLTTLKDGIKVHFFPSSFIINDSKWQLAEDGEIAISKSLVSASDVKFVNGEQQIKISTQPSETGSTNDIVVDLLKLHVDDIAAFGLKDPALQGEATGTVIIENPFEKPFINYDIRAEGFKFGNDSIGLLRSNGTYDIGKGILYTKTTSDNKENNLDIEGTINLKQDSLNSGVHANLSLKSEKLNLSFLNAYLGDIFSDIQGTANTSDFVFSSDGKNVLLTGTANINEATMVVNYTQCKYSFKNKSIIFNPNEIDFGTIELKDTLNNTGTLSGKLYHHFFKDIEFDNISLESPRLLVLNTTRKDNSQFYGKVIGKVDKFQITGSQDNIVMDIKGAPSVTDSSHVYIVSGNSIEKETIDYIDFVQFGTAMEQAYVSKSTANVLVDMELTANPSCKVDVILDEATGDVIKGTGNGILKIRVGNKEDLTINGRYDITQGEYTFNFQTFLKKYFTVNSGSSIVWSGDPFKARIDITAEYLATNVNLKPLSSTGTSTAITGTSSYNAKSDVKILAHLTETLLKPKIDFDLQLPQGSSSSIDFLVLKKLEQFKNDENELNKQITSLLLFNSFISTDQAFITASGGYNILSGTIGGVVSGAVSGFFNNLLQKYVKNLSFNFDLNSSIDETLLQQNVSKLQAAAKSNFVYTLMNGSLIISAGLNVDYNNPYANRNTSVLVTPDVTVEWIITKNGRVRLVGFNRTNYDLVGQRNRTGVSLAYRRDFDKISKLVANILFFEWASKRRGARLKN